jgi:hypothetical protein
LVQWRCGAGSSKSAVQQDKQHIQTNPQAAVVLLALALASALAERQCWTEKHECMQRAGPGTVLIVMHNQVF